jgi:hypothetical protein
MDILMRLFAVIYTWRIVFLMQQSHKISHGFFLIFSHKGHVLPVSFCQDAEEDSLELGSGALESVKYSNTQM